MKTEVEFTHRGWFGLCPIIISDLDSGSPIIEARWACLDWFLTVNEFIQDKRIDFMMALDDNFEPSFSILVSGELDNPIYIDYED